MNDIVTNVPHAIGNQSEVLNRIFDPGVNLSLWQRPAHAAISGEMSSLKTSSFYCTNSLDSLDDDVGTL